VKCSVEGCAHSTTRVIKGMCVNHYQAQYEATHPEYVRKKLASSREWFLNHKELCKSYHKSSKNRFRNFVNCAKRRGLEVSINFEQWVALVIGAVCVYCGGNLPQLGSGVDRKNSALGYVVDNVVPCCTACNQIKGEDNITYAEMLYLMPLLRQFRTNRLAQAAHKI